jgi:phenylpropionate dioxygenase-like ring-hydroxylating dioxygenase large terminal subunit
MDICRYDVLVENLMDPAHVPYAHKGLMGKLRKKEDPGRYVPCPDMIGAVELFSLQCH